MASVLSVTLKDYPGGHWIVAAIATSSTFLIGVQQHLKVEAKAESHRISAHRFDQLVTEAVSRSIITGITVRDVAEWEKELHRIAEANQFVLPARIRRKAASLERRPQPASPTLKDLLAMGAEGKPGRRTAASVVPETASQVEMRPSESGVTVALACAQAKPACALTGTPPPNAPPNGHSAQQQQSLAPLSLPRPPLPATRQPLAPLARPDQGQDESEELSWTTSTAVRG